MNTESKKEYLTEAALALSHEGFQVKRIADDKLRIWLEGEPLCEVSEIGVVTYHNENIAEPERERQKDRVYRTVCNTAEYMRQLASAPPLKVADLSGCYKVLADFNGTVLAATQSSQGIQFVTWDWDFDRKGVSHGHYYGGNYEGAKQDFALRSGLISRDQIFSEEQIIPLYRACEDALQYGLDMTDADRRTLHGVYPGKEVKEMQKGKNNGNSPKFKIRPASSDEAGLFYAQHPAEDERLGCIGHVRMDFGKSGNEFWHSWWPRGPEELNSPEFKAELQKVVDELRLTVLKNRFAMENFCYAHGGKIDGGYVQNYGYIVETEHYRYCLRCNPSPGDYNAYLTTFDLDVQRQNMAQKSPVGRVTFANGETQEFINAEKYLQCIRDELPDHPVTGFRYETLTDDPAVRKAVDDILYDLYGEENPRQIEDYETKPAQGMTMGGI